MKKKQIEKIPYITVPGVLEKEKAEYVAVTAWKNIGKERHIILEVYRNQQECLTVPLVRYAATKKDWGVYFPESGAWTRQSITFNQYNNGLCWYDAETRKLWVYQEKEKANRLHSEKDLDRIKKFFIAEKGSLRYGYWWSYFTENENAIREGAIERRNRRRGERLRERIANTPELPEAEILTWAEQELFHAEHYLYYRKKGSRAEICCSKCGRIQEGKWKAGESYISQFESLIPEPVNGHVGRCGLCGAYGEYKPQGKVKMAYQKEKYVFTADKYKENGVVIRYINLQKEWVLEENIGDKGVPEMSGAYEKLSGIEVARAYFEPGRKVQIDYHKHDGGGDEDFWDDCNLYGLTNICIRKAELYPGIGEKMKGTCMQYSALELYRDHAGDVNAVDYLTRYQQMPQIEMLVKMGLYEIVEELVKCYCGIIANDRASRPEEFLGIRKDKLRFLAGENGNIELLKLLQEEKRLGENWKAEQLLALREIGFTPEKVRKVTKIMTVQKLLNLIAKYAGCEYGTECRHAEARLRHIATIYFDYLEMRKEQGYDLTNTVYQRPRDLEAAHNSIMMERDREKIEKRTKEVKERYPQIRKQYRKLRKKYYYEDETYLIRPAMSAEEIVKEGRILHHCVGGNDYLERHDRGKSIILFLRYKSEKEIPYITVEIEGERIVQWYGAYDKKPDQKHMQKWLDNYVTRLKCAGDGENQEQEEIRILAG